MRWLKNFAKNISKRDFTDQLKLTIQGD